MKGIDLFVKILIFDKIFVSMEKKKEGRIFILRSAIASTSNLKMLSWMGYTVEQCVI